MMIDTHCHVYASEMENAEEIIVQAAENDIVMIVNGTDPQSNLEVLELAARHENVYAALGYFYSFADEITDEHISLLDSQLDNDKVVAVGEIGMIVHSRKAMQDTYDILKRHDVVGSLHAYGGSAEMARDFIKLGFYIGIGGPVTHKNNKKTRKVLKNIGIDHVLVETDSPYMAPEEKRGEQNTSLNIKYVIEKIADELGMSESEVIEITSRNAGNLFGI